jgi:hypothetical protein
MQASYRIRHGIGAGAVKTKNGKALLFDSCAALASLL